LGCYRAIGEGGTVTITANNLAVTNQALVAASTQGDGDAGNIIVTANQFNVGNGGRLSTTSTTAGRAGDIRLNVQDQVTLAGDSSGLFANTTQTSSGNGGSIRLNSSSLEMRDRARISVDSQGSGEGGNIQIQANALTLDTNAAISAQTASNTGGNITLTVPDLLLLRRGSTISTTAGTAQGNGNGGNIAINAGFIVAVPFENSDITANAFLGSGGTISIQTQGIFGIPFRPALTPFSDITASSQFGLAGTVAITTLGIDPVQGTVNLPTTFSQPPLAQGCRATSRTGSFKNVGQGGIAANPVDPVIADAIWQDVEPLEKMEERGEIEKQEQSATSNPQSAIVEAQGWVVLPNGTIALIAGHSTEASRAIVNPAIDCASSRVSTP
jgi:large exoprotein involved in heme utilization and adhesion